MSRIYSCSVLLVLALLCATSCSNEEMSNYTYYESAWCVVQGRSNQISLVTDQKDILKPSESLDSTQYKAGDRYRVIYITLGNQGYYSTSSGAKLVKITGEPQPVLVEDVIQHGSFTGSVNDPVWLNAKPFLGGGFLNFDFQFRNSHTDVKHGIHLLQDSLVNRKLYLKFGHHANGDVSGSLESALASFPTSGLQNASDADSLIILSQGDIRLQNYRLALRDTL
jgi:NigD-like C-terminal beta sandwich domain